MFEGKPVNVDGFEIPYDGFWFLVILSVHIAAGLTCVVSGIFAMLSKKQRGMHTKSGKIYYWGTWIAFFTAALIAIARWKEDYPLFILGFISFASAVTGRMAVKRKWSKWSIYHICGMSTSYIFLLVAFYVDNGKFLPLWKDLPPVLYWLLPVAIGIPLVVRTLLSNPLSRHYFGKK